MLLGGMVRLVSLPGTPYATAVPLSHVVGFPVLSFLLLRGSTKPTAAPPSKVLKVVWQNYLAGDYPPNRFYLYHMNLGVVLVLALVLALGSEPSIGIQVCVCLEEPMCGGGVGWVYVCVAPPPPHPLAPHLPTTSSPLLSLCPQH